MPPKDHIPLPSREGEGEVFAPVGALESAVKEMRDI